MSGMLSLGGVMMFLVSSAPHAKTPTHSKMGQSMSESMSLEERKVVYRARRGLKEIDVYFDPYVRQHYLQADAAEKALFAQLVEQEDPDLLDWFMQVSAPPSEELAALIQKLKDYVHGNP